MEGGVREAGEWFKMHRERCQELAELNRQILRRCVNQARTRTSKKETPSIGEVAQFIFNC